MPHKPQESARQRASGPRLAGQPHPTPANASTDGAAGGMFAGRLLQDFKRWEGMTEAERAAYDLGRAAGRAEGPVILAPERKPARVRIPKLTLPNLPRYIAAVNLALERGELDAPKARAMLYGAQMLLACWNALGEVLPDDDAKTRIGFIQAAAETLKRKVSRCPLR